jgi:hypothetical protein
MHLVNVRPTEIQAAQRPEQTLDADRNAQKTVQAADFERKIWHF